MFLLYKDSVKNSVLLVNYTNLYFKVINIFECLLLYLINYKQQNEIVNMCTKSYHAKINTIFRYLFSRISINGGQLAI